MLTITNKESSFSCREEKLVAYMVEIDNEYIDNDCKKKVTKYFLRLWAEGLYGFIELMLPDDEKERDKIINEIDKKMGGDGNVRKRKKDISKPKETTKDTNKRYTRNGNITQIEKK